EGVVLVAAGEAGVQASAGGAGVGWCGAGVDPFPERVLLGGDLDGTVPDGRGCGGGEGGVGVGEPGRGFAHERGEHAGRFAGPDLRGKRDPCGADLVRVAFTGDEPDPTAD